MVNVYFISGLGADKSAFSRIQLKDVNIHHVLWVKNNSTDNLTSYCQKLLSQFNTSEPFIIVGLSFGGIIAQELNKYASVKKTIIISSVKHHTQFPWFYALGKWIVPLIPRAFFLKTNSVINYLFGAKGKNIAVLNAIMKANDPAFVKWCVNQLLNWKKKVETSNLITIHGTDDKIIPFYQCDYRIEKGSHFMVYSRAKEISRILQIEIDACCKE